MAGISIPPEILRQIFSYLQVSDTVNVGRVSWQWHACSQERLYLELQLMQPNSSPTLLLRTLLAPGLEKLATYVRTLNVNWEFVNISPMAEGDFAVLEEAAARIGRFDIVRSIEEQVWLLLHLLPRLDALTLERLNDSTTILALIGGLQRHANLPSALRSVRHFTCLDVMTADTLLAIFSLPRIRKIEVWPLDVIRVPYLAVDQHTSAVTDLHLSFSWVDHLSVRHILQLPRALTRLTISLHFVQHTGQFALMRAALEPVRLTLQRLTLYTMESVWYEQVPIESFLLLRTWPVLRRLGCAVNWLLGQWMEAAELHLYSVLPRSLREFAVEGDRSWTDERLVRELILLLERKAEVVPMLESVWINRMEGGELEHNEESELLQQLCGVGRDVGVVVTEMGNR